MSQCNPADQQLGNSFEVLINFQRLESKPGTVPALMPRRDLSAERAHEYQAMTQDQIFAFAVLSGLMVLFLWGRFRYDLVAVLALLAAVFTGIVPHNAAFSGFGDDIVIIVASALVVSAAVERSGIIGATLHRISPRITSVQGQIVVLVTTVTVLSAFASEASESTQALALLMLLSRDLLRRL